jgi:molecular chaperone DnaK
VQFDFDIDGILHVSAVDRGSGKQAHTTVTAARVRLDAAQIADRRADLEELEWEDDEAAETAVLAGAELSLEVGGLLARARRMVAEGKGDPIALETTSAALEAAARNGDQAGIEQHSDTLLDLLYEADQT